MLGGSDPVTFKNRATVIEPIDSHAQSYVARKMAEVAVEKKPKFVINVGDLETNQLKLNAYNMR